MPIHKLKLIKRQEIAAETWLFHFEKPEGFNFIPGQYGGFTLIEPKETDTGGITRRFSLLSIPSDNHIAIATRAQQSAYKRELNKLPLGSEIKFAGPTGAFILHHDANIPAVLIAGGIGITPFYSMIRDAIKNQPQQQIILFYGNQTLADAALLNELQTLAQQHPQLKLIATLANPHAEWDGESGFITHTMIKKYVPDLTQPIYYICGSPMMVNTLHETLQEMGIDETQIKVEDFPGY